MADKKDLETRVAELENSNRILKERSITDSYITNAANTANYYYAPEQQSLESAIYDLRAKIGRLERFLGITEKRTPATVEYVKLDKK